MGKINSIISVIMVLMLTISVTGYAWVIIESNIEQNILPDNDCWYDCYWHDEHESGLDINSRTSEFCEGYCKYIQREVLESEK